MLRLENATRGHDAEDKTDQAEEEMTKGPPKSFSPERMEEEAEYARAKWPEEVEDTTMKEEEESQDKLGKTKIAIRKWPRPTGMTRRSNK